MGFRDMAGGEGRGRQHDTYAHTCSVGQADGDEKHTVLFYDG